MLKKTDVYRFVDKVQQKAIKSVREKYDAELKLAIETDLNKPCNAIIKTSIDAMEYHLNLGCEANEILRKHIPKCCSYLSKYNMRKELFHDDWNIPQDFETVRMCHAENKELIKRTKEEYAKIMRVVTAKKTGEQGKTALIALEFDVTWLDNLSNLPVIVNPTELVIDKALIFPCGESGV